MGGVHAHKSPSKAGRLHACPGFLALVESMPECLRQQAGAAAERGTAAHALLERCLQTGETAADYEGRVIAVLKDGGTSILRRGCKVEGEGRWLVDPHMVWGVDLAREYVWKRCGELSVKPEDLILEQRTNPLPERDDTFGTADVTLDAWPDLLEVIDYKHGQVTVEHEDNPQLLCYLLGKAHDTNWDHAEYQITVIQPNADHEGGKIRSQKVTKEELRDFKVRHRKACNSADRAAEDFADTEEWAERWLNADDHCSMCEAVGICRARFALTQEQIGVDFGEEPETLQPPEELGTAVKVARWAKQIKAHLEAAEKFVEASLSEGQKWPGVTLEKRYGYRTWLPVEPDVTVDSLIKEGFISDDQRKDMFTEPALITGPKAEKLVPAKRRKEFSDKFLHRNEIGVKVVFTKPENE